MIFIKLLISLKISLKQEIIKISIKTKLNPALNVTFSRGRTIVARKIKTKSEVKHKSRCKGTNLQLFLNKLLIPIAMFNRRQIIKTTKTKQKTILMKVDGAPKSSTRKKGMSNVIKKTSATK